MERAICKRFLLCAAMVLTALACKLCLPDGAEYLKQLIAGAQDDPVTTACIAFQQAVEGGGSLSDGIAAFCDGLTEYDDEA